MLLAIEDCPFWSDVWINDEDWQVTDKEYKTAHVCLRRPTDETRGKGLVAAPITWIYKKLSFGTRVSITAPAPFNQEPQS